MSVQSEERIFFFSEDLDFQPKDKTVLRLWIAQCIKNEGKKLFELNYIFCSDEKLREINVEHLQHDYYTDIITFDSSAGNGKNVSGDIFISIDRVRDNAQKYGESFSRELRRVLIHGVLHLCGYGDKTDAEIAIMREREEHWLKKY